MYVGEEKAADHQRHSAPYINKAVAMATVDKRFMEPGTKVVIDVCWWCLGSEAVPMPYQRPKGK